MIKQPRVPALVGGAGRDFSADLLLVLAARAGRSESFSLRVYGRDRIR